MLRALRPTVRIWLATIWVGSLWTTGYLTAPTLFAQLQDRVLAGTVAGHMFTATATVSMISALVMFSMLMGADDLDPKRRLTALKLTGFMLACTLVSHYGLQPMMAELKALAGPSGVMESEMAGRFGMLHGVSSVLFMLQSVAGAWLVLRVR